MSIGISDLSLPELNYNYGKSGKKNATINEIYTPLFSGTKTLSDSSDEGAKQSNKVGFLEGVKAIGKGLIKPIKNMIEHPIKTALFIGATTAAIAATGGAAIPLLLGAGVAVGGFQVGKGLYKAITADTKQEKLAGLESIGEGAFTLGATAFGAKAYKGAGSATSAAAEETTLYGKIMAYSKGLFQDTVSAVKDIPSSFKSTFSVIRSGEFATNVQYSIKKSILDIKGQKFKNPSRFANREEFLAELSKYQKAIDKFHAEFGFKKPAQIYNYYANKGLNQPNIINLGIEDYNPLNYINPFKNAWNTNLAIGIGSEFGNEINDNELLSILSKYGLTFGIV